MIRSITYINPHKTALTLSLVAATSSLFFLIPMGLMTALTTPADAESASPSPTAPEFSFILIIIMPILHFVFGYIFTALSCWIYIKVASFTGGINLVISE